MIILFFSAVISFALCYVLAGGRYNMSLRLLTRKDYPLLAFLPVGLFLLDLVKYPYSTAYDRKLLWKVIRLHEQSQGRMYLQILWANKIVYAYCGLVLAGFIGAASGGFDFLVFCLSLGLVLGMFFLPDYEIEERIKKKYLTMQIEFPEILNKMTLLLSAGLTIPRAWEKIVRDNTKDTALYRELNKTLLAIQSGTPYLQAYEDFAKRCRTPEITKYISLLIQNMKKGNAELVAVLTLLATECWEMRKNTAKRLGEEASTKLLLPMMLMFGAILLIVATPAVLALKGF